MYLHAHANIDSKCVSRDHLWAAPGKNHLHVEPQIIKNTRVRKQEAEHCGPITTLSAVIYT